MNHHPVAAPGHAISVAPQEFGRPLHVSTSVDDLMKVAFCRPRADRSHEYKAGVRALLSHRIDGIKLDCPHAAGTAQSDAFWSGADEGRKIWSDAQAHHPQPALASTNGLADVHGTADDLVPAERPRRSLAEYARDDYSRVGCTLVVSLEEKGWSLIVYAPGCAPVPASVPIESYFSRPYGSMGIALQAFLHRPGGIRAALPEMARAERSQQAASGKAKEIAAAGASTDDPNRMERRPYELCPPGWAKEIAAARAATDDPNRMERRPYEIRPPGWAQKTGGTSNLTSADNASKIDTTTAGGASGPNTELAIDFAVRSRS